MKLPKKRNCKVIQSEVGQVGQIYNSLLVRFSEVFNQLFCGNEPLARNEETHKANLQLLLQVAKYETLSFYLDSIKWNDEILIQNIRSGKNIRRCESEMLK